MGKFPKQHVNIPFEDEKLPDSGINGTLGGRRQQGRRGGHVCESTYSPMPGLGGSTCGAQLPTCAPSRGTCALALTLSPLPI